MSHDTSGAQHATPEPMSMVAALNAGLRRALEADPKVLVLGEDVGRLGGVFRVTDGLAKDFGEDRVVDTPLAESGILGAAVGLCLRGYRPVCEIQFDGFVYPAFDQIVSQVAKLRFRSQGLLSIPLVVRIPYGGGIGAVEHHSESPEAYFVHTAGLRVVTPSTPQDAYWMVQQAVATEDPVIFLEPKRRYWQSGEVEREQTPGPLFAAAVRRAGTDVTLVTYGPTVKTCLDAAEVAESEGHAVEVLDLRTLSPIDWASVLGSARRTGRVVVVHEAPRTLGVGAEIAAQVTESCFTDLLAPVLRVTGWDTPYPPSRVESLWLPDVDRVLDAIDTVLEG